MLFGAVVAIKDVFSSGLCAVGCLDMYLRANFTLLLATARVFQFECCGVDGPETWEDIVAPHIPDTCCVENSDDCGRNSYRDALAGDDAFYQQVCTTSVRLHLNL